MRIGKGRNPMLKAQKYSTLNLELIAHLRSELELDKSLFQISCTTNVWRMYIQAFELGLALMLMEFDKLRLLSSESISSISISEISSYKFQ